MIGRKKAAAAILCMCLVLTACAPGSSPSPPLAPAAENRSTPEMTTSPAHDPYLATRRRMVQTQMREQGITDSVVLDVMEKVPRDRFVLPQDVDRAYADSPLPIGYGQTISQPYMVALMTQLLNIKQGDKILEIGTGSGYQAAILAELTEQVYTVEIIPELAAAAAQHLQELGYTQVHTRNADGYYGWEEFAPYDAIIVTAAPDHIPQPLIKQLKDGGRLVIPMGPPGTIQTLWMVERQGDQVLSHQVANVLFVPLTGKH